MIGTSSSRSHRRAASIAAAALLAAGSACKKDEPTGEGAILPAAAGEPTVTVTKETAPDSTGRSGAPARVVLLEAGKEPRAQLRYHLPSTSKEKMGMTITMAVEMGMTTQTVNVHLAPMRMEMELGVTEKLGDREVRVRFRVTRAELEEGGDQMFATMREQLATELKKMVGAAGTLVMDNRGLVRDMTLALPDGMDPQMKQTMESSRQAMEQISSPLPEEAVGVGARWQVEQVLAQNGLVIKQTSVFELAELRGTRGTLRTTVVQSADPQIAELAGLPAGVQAQLLSHSGAGNGTGELDLGQLVPGKSSKGVKTETAIKVTGQGQDQTMQIKNDTKIELGRL
jgi:hypothetical protein